MNGHIERWGKKKSTMVKQVNESQYNKNSSNSRPKSSAIFKKTVNAKVKVKIHNELIDAQDFVLAFNKSQEKYFHTSIIFPGI